MPLPPAGERVEKRRIDENRKPDEDPEKSGHTVFINALHQSDNSDENGELIKDHVVYKLNKHGDPLYSRFEIAFYALISRFLKPNLTPNQRLVVADEDSNTILGIVSEHLFTEIIKKEQDPEPTFYGINENVPQLFIAQHQNSVIFLNSVSSDFFAKLLQKEREGQCTIDIGSLASLLTASYTLEEDDLHKGNIAFYIVERNGKPHVVFQKIDHDLLFANSIMSHFDARIANWYYSDSSFAITPEDLLYFPHLRNAQNHYWPTSFRVLINPLDDKTYSYAETKAFASLATRDEFIKAKWHNFYKHTLIPTDLIKKDLQTAYRNSKAESARITMISHAVVARQAQLRAALFSLPEFRQYVNDLSEDEHQELINEILIGVPEYEQSLLRAEILNQINFHKTKIQKFVVNDSPLHVAIRLGDYRYEETWDAFGQYAEDKNANGMTPLELTISLQDDEPPKTNDMRVDPYLICYDLLDHGVDSEAFDNLSTAWKNKKMIREPANFNKYRKANSSDPVDAAELIRLIKTIGEDHRYCLKTRKILAVKELQHFINANRNQPAKLKHVLIEFKDHLNGTGSQQFVNPDLMFIHQLRSKLWIIRLLRGLWGQTTTLDKMNTRIDDKLADISPSGFLSCCGFFSDTIENENNAASEPPQPK